MSTKEIIPDMEIKRIHGYAEFGSLSKRGVVNLGVLKAACGRKQDDVSRSIIFDHGLIDDRCELTAKGKCYLWEVFRGDQ